MRCHRNLSIVEGKRLEMTSGRVVCRAQESDRPPALRSLTPAGRHASEKTSAARPVPLAAPRTMHPGSYENNPYKSSNEVSPSRADEGAYG